MDQTYSEAVTAADAARMQEHRERVERDEREWRTAQLHFRLHHNYLSPDECATCLYDAEKAGPGRLGRIGRDEFEAEIEFGLL